MARRRKVAKVGVDVCVHGTALSDDAMCQECVVEAQGGAARGPHESEYQPPRVIVPPEEYPHRAEVEASEEVPVDES